MAPLLRRLLADHPAIRLDLSVCKVPPDLVREGFDAGIRLGEQVERDFVAARRFRWLGLPLGSQPKGAR